MRVSVNEVSPGLHRWVASLHNRWGVVVASAFSNNSADDAEDQLLYDLAGALTRLPAMTAAKGKALAALKSEHEARIDLLEENGDEHQPCVCEVCAMIKELEGVDEKQKSCDRESGSI